MAEPAPAGGNEQEVYETADTPEFDNGAQTWQEADSDSIDTSTVDPQSSYAVFAATTDIGGGDFSGTAEAYARFKAHTVPRGSLESPLQKLERLKMETVQLQKHLKTASEQGGFAGQMYPQVVTDELTALQTQISGIGNQLSAESPIMATMATSTADKLIADVGTFASGAAVGGKTSKKGDAAAGGPSSVTYELYVEPTGAGADSAMSRVADMERRLAKLEKSTGIMENIEHSTSLSKTIDVLDQKVSLLDKGQLQALSAIVTDVQNKLKVAVDQKKELSKQHSEKVNIVADAVVKWTPISEELPLITERLYQLKRVHDQAAQFVGSFATIANEQTAMTKGMKNQDQLLEKVQKGLADNMKTMAANIKSLEARFDKAKLK